MLCIYNLRINLHESAASFLGPEDAWGHPKVNEQNWTKQVWHIGFWLSRRYAQLQRCHEPGMIHVGSWNLLGTVVNSHACYGLPLQPCWKITLQHAFTVSTTRLLIMLDNSKVGWTGEKMEKQIKTFKCSTWKNISSVYIHKYIYIYIHTYTPEHTHTQLHAHIFNAYININCNIIYIYIYIYIYIRATPGFCPGVAA